LQHLHANIFGHSHSDLQCLEGVHSEPVRGVNTREECQWSRAWQRFKRSKGVKPNGTPRVKNAVEKRAPYHNLMMLTLTQQNPW
jgi:hypothetical protein